jgi:hypothetical protein
MVGGKLRVLLGSAILVFGCTQVVIQEAASSTSGSSEATTGGGVPGATSASTTTASTATASSGANGGAAAGGESGTGGTGGVMPNACGSKCGPVELCDEAHLGLDDDCDGQVDEGCTCEIGTAHFCFAGDPSYHELPGCFDGVELCQESGFWGPCAGGVQATPPDNCFSTTPSTCHAITTRPFLPVGLKTGTGAFSANAVPGSEMWQVTCPQGVPVCPGVSAPDQFEPLQSGEYTVTYTKMVQGSGQASCTYPLLVGDRGMRIELSWEHPMGDMGVDLDLHVHQPNDTKPWGISPGVEQDCCWSTCGPPEPAPHWFADPPAMPPTPVNWWNDPVPQNNTCYNDPKGVGPEWKQLGMGCHNPRLDADVITCDSSVTNPNDPDFCTPENVNIDYPPVGQWTRIGVHYYNNHGLSYDVHPVVKVFCDGALSGQLGPTGYYVPQAPVTFEPADGAGIGGNRFWIVADVAFQYNACGPATCTVKPVYSDPTNKTPLFTIDTGATTTFAPPYPPPP